MIDPTLIVLRLSFILAVMVALASVWVLLLHFRNRRNTRQREQLYSKWRPLILQYLAGGELASELKMGAKRHPRLLLDLLTHQGTLLSGSTFDRLKQLVAETGLAAYSRRAMRSRNEWKSSEAARAAALFADEEARPQLMKLLDSSSPGLVFAAALGLARIGNPVDFPKVLETLAEFSNTNQDLVTFVLLSYGQLHREQFVNYLHQHQVEDDDLHVVVLDLIGTLKMFEAADLLKRELTEPRNEEALLKAIRGLGEMAAADARHQIAEYAHYPSWVVRAVTAWCLGKLRDTARIPLLQQMLSDEHWSVRLNASAALAAMDSKGESALQDVRTTAEDPFAADMAAKTLELKRLAIPLQ